MSNETLSGRINEAKRERAFPVPGGISHGMTLRDYFAAAVLQGAFAEGAQRSIQGEAMKVPEAADFTPRQLAGITNGLIAKMAYEMADAMLAEREKAVV